MKKSRGAIWAERTLLKFTPPLRGSHRGRAVCAKAESVGGHATEKLPPPSQPSPVGSASSTPPQGGSEFLLYSVDNFPQGVVEKGHISGVEEKPLSPGKATPPTPPCQGGIKRRCPPMREKRITPPLRVITKETRREFTPPLRGSRRAEGVSPKAIRWGEFFCGMSPHRFSLRTNRSASSSGFPLGKPDPQGGS